MVQYNLTNGAIEAIMAGKILDRPVVQVLGQKMIPASAGSADRYRLLLSDGVNSHSSCMLATQLNDKIVSGELDTYAVIRLDKYICNPINPERRVMIVLEVTVVAPSASVGQKIGNPQQLRSAGGADQNAAPPATSVAPPPVKTIAQPLAKPASSSSSVISNQVKPTGQMSSNQNSAATKSFYTNSAANAPVKTEQNRPYGAGASSKQFGAAASTSSNTDTPLKVQPIISLTPYQNRWTIKGRVTLKTPLKTWSNSRGEGTLFSFNLLDESGELRCTAFKADAERFFNLVEMNKVYYVRRGQLKPANKQFSNVQNDYELTLNQDSEIIPCDEPCDLPAVTFNFVPISQLESRQPNEMIDVIGVVKEVQEIKTIITKATQKEMKKREVVLVDESRVQINLTLWGAEAESFDGGNKPILAVKGARLSDWNGRSLSTGMNSQLMLDPDIVESHRLRGWYDSEGHSVEYNEYRRDGGTGGGGSTNWKLLGEVKAQNLTADGVEYFNFRGEVAHLKKDNCLYQACPQAECNKKVIDQGNGHFRCEKCQKEFDTFKWRLMLQINAIDFLADIWLTCFQDTAEQILQKKAEEIGHLRENAPSEFDAVFEQSQYQKFIFRCRSKMETFNDESRLKTICVQVSPENYPEKSRRQLAEIETMLGSA